MLRTFRVQTLSGNAQPLFGDVTTTAIIPPPPGGDVRVTVADTTLYQLGDRIIAGAGSATNNILIVDQKISATVMMCRSEGDAKVAAYPVGTILALSMACSEIIVQAVAGGANPIWIGSDNTVTSAGLGNVVYQVTPSIAPYRTGSSPYNTVRTSDAWMASLAGTQVIVSANIV